MATPVQGCRAAGRLKFVPLVGGAGERALVRLDGSMSIGLRNSRRIVVRGAARG